jgi:hypothetical protein
LIGQFLTTGAKLLNFGSVELLFEQANIVLMVLDRFDMGLNLLFMALDWLFMRLQLLTLSAQTGFFFSNHSQQLSG